jgi:DNA repair protein RecN (Recombination protein N)
MLSTLRVRNVGSFLDVTVEFDEGLTVLTGETGAGKTLLVEALHLVLGGTDRALPVRDPTASSLVEATFLDGTDEVVAARERSASGRLRAMLDGVTTSAKALSERTAAMCELHGQHEHQVLRRPGAARVILDRSAGIDDSDVRRLRREYREVLAVRERLGGSAPERTRHLELLSHERDEIDAAAPTSPTELEELVEEAVELTALVDARDAITRAIEALDTDGDAASAAALLGGALAELPKELAARSELAELLDRTRLLAATLRRELDHVGDEPGRLDDLNGRISTLQGLVRKHGHTLDNVLVRRKALEAELAQLTADEARAGVVEAELGVVASSLASAETDLASKRLDAGVRLSAEVRSRLGDLALGHAQFDVSVEGTAGDEVGFLFAGSAGFDAAPLADAASGGELSRVMLALTLATRATAACTIFDEVDAGVGGATALALATCLRELSEHSQVVVVTHLASVAAVADHQLVVTAAPDGEGSLINEVVGEERVRELARMLAGDPDHPDAVAHARALLRQGPPAS